MANRVLRVTKGNGVFGRTSRRSWFAVRPNSQEQLGQGRQKQGIIGGYRHVM